MMNIVKNALAGSLESSDILVMIEPAEHLDITVQSPVLLQFGSQIEDSARDELLRLGVVAAKVHLNDRGALDCVIRARVETAARRGSELS